MKRTKFIRLRSEKVLLVFLGLFILLNAQTNTTTKGNQKKKIAELQKKERKSRLAKSKVVKLKKKTSENQPHEIDKVVEEPIIKEPSEKLPENTKSEGKLKGSKLAKKKQIKVEKTNTKQMKPRKVMKSVTSKIEDKIVQGIKKPQTHSKKESKTKGKKKIFILKKIVARKDPNKKTKKNTKPAQKPKTKTLPKNSSGLSRVIKDFPSLELETFVNKHEYVVVLLLSAENAERSILWKKFITLGKSFAKSEVYFLQVTEKSPDSTFFTVEENRSLPSVFLFVTGSKRHFNGELIFGDLKIWLREAMKAKPFKIAKISDIEKEDAHYFVYAPMKWVLENKEEVAALAKLISPIGFYTGLSKKVLSKILKGQTPSSDLFTFREHDGKLIEVNTKAHIDQKVRQIVAGELVDFVACDEKALTFLKEVKVPSLIYFSDTEAFNDDWSLVRKVAKEFKEYLLPVFVSATANDICTRFLDDFLEVEKKPSLRILNMSGKVKRHIFVGKFEEKAIRFFLQNYIGGNLQNYHINEKLAANANFKSLSLANYKQLKTLRLGSNNDNLIYVHGHETKDFEKHVAELQKVQREYSETGRLKVYLLNHDKNDLNGFYNHHIPFVFFINAEGKFVLYQKKVEYQPLVSFLKNKFKYLSQRANISEDL